MIDAETTFEALKLNVLDTSSENTLNFLSKILVIPNSMTLKNTLKFL